MTDELDDHDRSHEDCDSFEATWDALSGRAGRRVPVIASLALDVSDGRPLGDHLKRLTELLQTQGVVVSAIDIGDTTYTLDGGEDWLWAQPIVANGTETTSSTSIVTSEASPHRGPDTGVSMLAIPSGGMLRAFMMSPEYEGVIGASLARDADGLEVMDDELGFMLAAQVERKLSAVADPEWSPTLVLPPRLASVVRRFLQPHAVMIGVVGFDQIPPGTQIECVEELRLPVPPYGRGDHGSHRASGSASPDTATGESPDLGDAMDWSW